jgi:hypothetical protein
MRRYVWFVVAMLASSVAIVPFVAGAAIAGQVDSVSPLSGPPGTVITVAGVCDDVGFDETIFLQLNSAADTFTGDIAQGNQPVTAGTGAFSATIQVPASIAAGSPVFVYAFCGGASGTITVTGCVTPSQCGEFTVTAVAPTAEPAAAISAAPRSTG